MTRSVPAARLASYRPEAEPAPGMGGEAGASRAGAR